MRVSSILGVAGCVLVGCNSTGGSFGAADSTPIASDDAQATTFPSRADEVASVGGTAPISSADPVHEQPGSTLEPPMNATSDPTGGDPSDPSGNADAGAQSPVSAAAPQGSSGEITSPLGDAAAPPQATDTVYNWPAAFTQDQLRTFSITLPDEEWQALRRNARDKEYVPAALAIDGEEVGSVGLRFKGGWSLDSCFTRSEESTCAKMSMKLKFDKYDDNLRWFGLKRVHLNSMKGDPSMLRERLAYKLWNDMGVVAPHATHVRVELNGEFHGLFALVEAIDGRFTDHYYGANGDGNLYKETWPLSENEQWYQENIKTNEAEATHDGILSFAADLATAAQGGMAGLPDVVARYTDPQALLRYMAIDLAVGHWDGVTAYYCTDDEDAQHLPQGCKNHNFYLYQHEEAARFELIPWDMDGTLNNDSFRNAGVPRWNDVPAECPADYRATGNRVAAPNCDPLFQGLALSEQTVYYATLQELLDGPFDLVALNTSIDEWAAQIEPAVREEPEGMGYDEWLEAVDGSGRGENGGGLRGWLQTKREHIEAELAR